MLNCILPWGTLVSAHNSSAFCTPTPTAQLHPNPPVLCICCKILLKRGAGVGVDGGGGGGSQDVVRRWDAVRGLRCFIKFSRLTFQVLEKLRFDLVLSHWYLLGVSRICADMFENDASMRENVSLRKLNLDLNDAQDNVSHFLLFWCCRCWKHYCISDLKSENNLFHLCLPVYTSTVVISPVLQDNTSCLDAWFVRNHLGYW